MFLHLIMIMDYMMIGIMVIKVVATNEVRPVLEF